MLLELIQKAADELRNTESGWVTRRDAAELLGKAAASALVVLHECRDEMDVDVRRSVDKALAQAETILRSAPKESSKHGGPCTLEALAKVCAKPGEREVKQNGEGYAIQVTLKMGRKQTVFLEQFRRRDDLVLIRIYTYCGAFSEDSAKWALKANTKLAQGAIAIAEKDGEEHFVIMNCFLAKEVSPAEVKASVKEIAFYGDWLEHKLSGMDDF